ncbi:hypothetical protein PR048_004392 [Dryococelus australis]|uniref:HTH CENPB-type domain-containing protein n=1 Tax=Dryococelus australis TaxID=614101 RepID=A0ABQ9I5B6_9NEOP|nr:hypothetical protein PR048_004392 [Dryococelus australis]
MSHRSRSWVSGPRNVSTVKVIVKCKGQGMGNVKCIFTPEQENELVDYITILESRLFGLTTKNIRHRAYNLAEKNHLKHTFSHENKCASLDWLGRFLKRHQGLTLRKPEATSASQAMGFKKTAVAKFFEILTSCFQRYNFSPERIYNVDEIGLTQVSKSQPKVMARKGISPKDIIPVLHCQRNSSGKSKGKAVVITDSPYKNELVEGSVTTNAGKQKVKREFVYG